MNGPTAHFAGSLLFVLTLVIVGCGKTANNEGRAVRVERFPNGYALFRYSGSSEFSRTAGNKGEDTIVLFDNASRPMYALSPSGQTIEFYKVVTKSNRDLIYAIPLGPYETRVYKGPFRPEEGFPERITNVRAVPDIDKAYLNPSAQQKKVWLEEFPMVDQLMLQR